LGATQIFGFAASAVANSIVDLETLVGSDADKLRATLIAEDSPPARFASLEKFVRDRIERSIAIPSFVREAASRIERTHGCLRVAELHEELDVSRKHLAVSFTRYVGVSAKAYARIQRFIWTVERLGASTDVEWSRISVEAGYSDQSHLVRDFRRIGAASPTEYLRRFAPDRDALLETAG
jgi:transcriptional regulator GlxA family with amidase domain